MVDTIQPQFLYSNRACSGNGKVMGVTGSKYCLLYFKKKAANDMADILKKYGFAGTFLAAREPKESYADMFLQL